MATYQNKVFLGANLPRSLINTKFINRTPFIVNLYKIENNLKRKVVSFFPGGYFSTDNRLGTKYLATFMAKDIDGREQEYQLGNLFDIYQDSNEYNLGSVGEEEGSKNTKTPHAELSSLMIHNNLQFPITLKYRGGDIFTVLPLSKKPFRGAEGQGINTNQSYDVYVNTPNGELFYRSITPSSAFTTDVILFVNVATF